MSDLNYLVTVVVPSHNRSKYAIPCIKGLLQIPSQRLQVVVHDTSNDECLLAQWAVTQTDSRLRYVHYSERLSMTENHERAVALAEGEYVCLIGDDDCVSARILQVADFARQQGIGCLTPRVKAVYSWPDFHTRILGAAHAGKVYLDSFDGALQVLDTTGELAATLAAACQGTDRLPKLYHGLVRRELLDTLRVRQGRVFFGTSPDISAAVGLALLCDEYHLIDLPFILPGASSGSNTGRSAINKHKGDLEKDVHMQPFKNLQWPELLPRFFSVETVWAHAAWETLRLTEADEWLAVFNLRRLYALCLINHWDYRQATFAAVNAARAQGVRGLSKAALTVECFGCAWRLVLSKAKRLLRPSASNGREVLAVVEDVYLARQALDERLANSADFERVVGAAQ